MTLPTPIGDSPDAAQVFGGTPKPAVETTALPKATAWFRLSGLVVKKALRKRVGDIGAATQRRPTEIW